MHLPTHSLTHPTPFNLVESAIHPPHNTHKMGMKGHPQSNCGAGGGGWMMKKKTAMLVVTMVVLVGVMGVMVVQRVRDRRLFNLVIKDKDRQILSLNLLLQKEKQYAKENKRKNQDLNAKLYSLRTQKVELNNKIMEMRSTIASMKDEHRALELAIDEKQNEIKHKESEIRVLKTNLLTPPKIWSTSSNDSSNHQPTRGSWFGQSSTRQNPNHQEIKNVDVKVQKAKDEDSEKLESSENNDDNAKTEMQNNINGTLAINAKWDSKENGNESKPGRRFFIGATENNQSGKSQLKANLEEGPEGEADRMDEDKASTEVDMNSSRKGSEEDQDYNKEESED